MMLILGFILGVFFTVLVIVRDACKSKRPKFWIDENYEIHLIRNKKR